MSRAGRSRRGFTLLETLAVVGITGFLVTAITGMYIGIMRNSERATVATRDVRMASAILDRVAHDLEQAYLLELEEDDDPLTHPWLFVSNNRTGQFGADQVMFTTLSHDERGRSAERASNSGLATYSYWLETNEDESYDLLRLIHPRPPASSSFPRGDEPGTTLVAQELGAFSLRFMDETGSWLDTWDSTTLIDSEQLPLMVEISLGFLPPAEAIALETADSLTEPLELNEYRRRVVLFQRPVSATIALGVGADGAGGRGSNEDEIQLFDSADQGCESGITWNECLNRQTQATWNALTPEERNIWNGRRNQCVPTIRMTSDKLDLSRCL